MMGGDMGATLRNVPSGTTVQGGRYCRGKHCGYDLRGLAADTRRFPECGRGFDPNDPRTYRKRPLRRWVTHVRHAAVALLALFLILAGTWGWFYWGWRDERLALLALKVNPDDPVQVQYTPLVSPELRSRLGSAGFVLDRASFLRIPPRYDPVDLAPVAHLTKLQTLVMLGAHPSDIGPLAGLTNLRDLNIDTMPTLDLAPLRGLRRLQRLRLYGRGVHDLGPLASLGQLQVLDVQFALATDLRPLAGLTNLRALGLFNTPVTDITPLLGLTKLQNLNLVGTNLTDPSPLAKLKGMRFLALPGTVTIDQANALRREMPAGCVITQ